MDERLERVYARWCARSVLHLWDAPEVVRRWVDTGEDDSSAAARATAGDAAWAAYAAARAAARDAVWAARAALAAAEGAAAGDAERAAARDAERAKQFRTLALLALLPDLLRTHGLAARLLDDAREDAWLTLQVVRALGLPDLAAWVDWCRQMEDNQ